MNQEMQIILWVLGILVIIFAGGLYFWSRHPIQPKPTMFEVKHETESDILTEVELRAHEKQDDDKNGRT